MSSNFVVDLSDEKEIRSYVQNCITNNDKIDRVVWARHFLTPANKRISLLSTIFEDKKKYYDQLYSFLKPSQINGMTLKYFGIPHACGEVSSHFLSAYSYLKKFTKAPRKAVQKNSKDKRKIFDGAHGSFDLNEIMKEEEPAKGIIDHTTLPGANKCPADCLNHFSLDDDDHNSIFSTQSSELNAQKKQEKENLFRDNIQSKQQLNILSKPKAVIFNRYGYNKDSTAKVMKSSGQISAESAAQVSCHDATIRKTWTKCTDQHAKNNKKAKKLYSSPENTELSLMLPDITSNAKDERWTSAQDKSTVNSSISKDKIMREYEKKLMAMKPMGGSQLKSIKAMKETKGEKQLVRRLETKIPQKMHQDLSKIKVQETIAKSKKQNNHLLKKYDGAEKIITSSLVADKTNKDASKKLNESQENDDIDKQNPEHSEMIEISHDTFKRETRDKQRDSSSLSSLSARFNDLTYSDVSMIQGSQSGDSVSSRKTHVSATPTHDEYEENLASVNTQDLNDLQQNYLISQDTSPRQRSPAISQCPTPKKDPAIEGRTVEINYFDTGDQSNISAHGESAEVIHQILDKETESRGTGSSPIHFSSSKGNDFNYSDISMIQGSQSQISSQKTHVSESTLDDESEFSLNEEELTHKLQNNFIPCDVSSRETLQTVSQCSTQEIDGVLDGSQPMNIIHEQSLVEQFRDNLPFKDFVYPLKKVPGQDDELASETSQSDLDVKSTCEQQAEESLKATVMDSEKEKNQAAQFEGLYQEFFVHQPFTESTSEMEVDDVLEEEDKMPQDTKNVENFKVNKEQDQQETVQNSSSFMIDSSQTSEPISSNQKTQTLRCTDLKNAANNNDQLTSSENEQEFSSPFSGTDSVVPMPRSSSRLDFDQNRDNANEYETTKFDSTLSPIFSRQSIWTPSVTGENMQVEESLQCLNKSEDRACDSEKQYLIKDLTLSELPAKLQGDRSSKQEPSTDNFPEDAMTIAQTCGQHSTENEAVNANDFDTLFSKVLMKKSSKEDDTDSHGSGSTCVTNLSSESKTSNMLKDALIVPSSSQSLTSNSSLSSIEEKIPPKNQRTKSILSQNQNIDEAVTIVSSKVYGRNTDDDPDLFGIDFFPRCFEEDAKELDVSNEEGTMFKELYIDVQKIFSPVYNDSSKSDSSTSKAGNSTEFSAKIAENKPGRNPLKDKNPKAESNVQQASSLSNSLLSEDLMAGFSPSRKESPRSRYLESFNLFSSRRQHQQKRPRVTNEYCVKTGDSEMKPKVEKKEGIKPAGLKSSDVILERKENMNILSPDTDENVFTKDFKMPLENSLSMSGTSLNDESFLSRNYEMKLLESGMTGADILNEEDGIVLKQFKDSKVNFSDTWNSSRNYSFSSSVSNIISDFSSKEESKDIKRRPLTEKNNSKESQWTANRKKNNSFHSQLQMDKIKWKSDLLEIASSQESGTLELSNISLKNSLEQKQPLVGTSGYAPKLEITTRSIKRKGLKADCKQGVKKSFGLASNVPRSVESSRNDKLKNYYDILGINDDDDLIDSYFKFP